MADIKAALKPTASAIRPTVAPTQQKPTTAPNLYNVQTPVPGVTPSMPQSAGGNKYVAPGTQGPSIGTNDKPVASSNGYVTFSNGATVPIEKTVGVPAGLPTNINQYGSSPTTGNTVVRQNYGSSTPSGSLALTADEALRQGLDIEKLRHEGRLLDGGGNTQGIGSVLGISYSPNWRSEADKIGKDVNSPDFAEFRNRDQANAPTTTSRGDIYGALSSLSGSKALEVLGKYGGQSSLDQLFSDYEGKTRDRIGGLASDIEGRAKDVAKRAYDTVISVLGSQKGEVSKTAEEQRARLEREGAFAGQQLEDKKQKDVADIEKQKGEFVEQQRIDGESLGKNWADMMRRTSAILRASGRDATNFASDKESKMIIEFNKGLRELKQSGQKVLGDFAEAVNETNKFYTSEYTKMDLAKKSAIEDIDAWERGEIGRIQGQEKLALNDQLSAIDQAVERADNMRFQVEQSLADKKYNLDQFVLQQTMSLQNSVAAAGQKRLSAAQAGVLQATQNVMSVKQIIDSGGQFVSKQAQGADGKPVNQLYVVGYNPKTGREEELPVGEAFTKSTIAGQLKNTNGFTDAQSEYQKEMERLNLVPKQQEEQPAEKTSIFSSIRSALGL